MKKNVYHIEVKPIADKDGNDLSHQSPIEFGFECHDDLLQIIERVKTLDGLTDEQKIPFALGLKMLGETILENRKHPLFTELGPAFGQFMKQMKQNIKQGQ